MQRTAAHEGRPVNPRRSFPQYDIVSWRWHASTGLQIRKEYLHVFRKMNCNCDCRMGDLSCHWYNGPRLGLTPFLACRSGAGLTNLIERLVTTFEVGLTVFVFCENDLELF